LLTDRRQIAGQIARLVDEIDEVLPDHAPRRIGNGEHELLGKMIGERDFSGNKGFEIVIAVLAAPAAAGPFGSGRSIRAWPRRRRAGILGKYVVEAGAQLRLHGATAG